MGVGEGTALVAKESDEALSHSVKVARMHKVYDMMREGEWREVGKPSKIYSMRKIFFFKVCNEFQGEDQYRETLLLWVRPSQVQSTVSAPLLT